LRNDAIRQLAYCFQAEGTRGDQLPYRASQDRSVDVIEKKPIKRALAWLVPAVGAGIFVTIQAITFGPAAF